MTKPVVRSGAKSSIDKFVKIVHSKLGADYQPEVILDLGAFNGDNAKALNRTWPFTKIYSWECHPGHLPLLREQVAGISNIVVVPFAAYKEHNNKVQFNMSNNLSTSSSLFAPNPAYRKIQPMPMQEAWVSTKRIDKWAEEESITKVDLIWADIQGAELMALQSMGELLNTVEAMQLEVEYDHVYLEQPLYPEIKDYLADKGFVVAKEWVGRKDWWGDAIFVKEAKDGLVGSEVGQLDNGKSGSVRS